MRNQLSAYIDLLFAGNPEAADIKEEILQNTLDRYDDMIAQGKTPEAAYSLAISGIGDLSEILASARPVPPPVSAAPVREPEETPEERKKRKLIQAIAVCLYILCPVPLFIIPGPVGLSLLLVIVAIATCMLVFIGKDNKEAQAGLEPDTPRKKLQKSINSLIWAIGTVIYFVISFQTGAWYITWVIFPLLGAIQGLISAIMDLKEE